MLNLKAFLFLCLFYTLIKTSQEPKLVFVQEVFRHGSRYPINSYKQDHSTFIKTIRSSGQLTKQGASMHYVLGKQLYKTYWKRLFGGTKYESVYNQSKIYVKSTDSNRTIESVQSQLQGILEELEPLTLQKQDIQFSLPQWPGVIDRPIGPVFTNSPRFHTVPIHTEKAGLTYDWQGDFLRHYDTSICLNQKQWQSQNLQKYRIEEITKDEGFQNVISELGKQINKKLTFWDVGKYYSNSECMTYMLSTDVLPIFKENSTTKATLNTIYTLDMHMKYFYTQQQLSATATGYFNETYHNFKKVINDKSGVQWAFYSAHDTTVNNYLAALNLTNVECIYSNFKKGVLDDTEDCISQFPHFSASLIFEIYEYSSGRHTLKIIYNGRQRKIPFCGGYECDINTFYSWFDSWKNMEYAKECGLYNKEAIPYRTLSIVEGTIIFCFLLGILVKHLSKKQENKDEVMNDEIH